MGRDRHRDSSIRSVLRAVMAAAASAIALALLAACSGSAASPVTPAPDRVATPAPDLRLAPNDHLIIGVSVPLTPAEQKHVGDDIFDAARLAVADYGGSVRGRQIDVILKDDGCNDPETSAAAAEAFAGQAGIAGVIGPICTTAAQASDSVYEEAHIVHISPAVTRPEVSSEGEHYFFRTAWRDDAQARTQAEYTHRTLNAQTAIVVDDGDPYGKSLAEAFVAAFEADGGRALAHERIDTATTDYPSLSKRLAGMGSDAIVFEGLNPVTAQLLMELRKAQYPGLFIAPDAALSVHDFLQAAGTSADGALVTGGPVPDIAFITRFHALTQRDPATAFVLQAHDAVTGLLKAIDAAATSQSDGSLLIDREALPDALRSRTLSGLTGTVRFDANGDRDGDTPSDRGITVYRVNAQKFEALP